MEVVAEGVETEPQLAMLKGLGCDRVQGYLLGKPQSADSILEKLTAPVACEVAG
jgi:Amt family ammonium transporter